LTCESIRETDHHHAMMQQRNMKAEDGHLLTAMLGGGAGKHTAGRAEYRGHQYR
jgi:hypothetical protein